MFAYNYWGVFNLCRVIFFYVSNITMNEQEPVFEHTCELRTGVDALIDDGIMPVRNIIVKIKNKHGKK